MESTYLQKYFLIHINMEQNKNKQFKPGFFILLTTT